MTTAVPPSTWVAMLKRSGAAWYSGAGDRYTMSAWPPKSSCSGPATAPVASSSGSAS